MAGALLVGVALVAAGCGGDDGDQGGGKVQDLAGTSWSLRSAESGGSTPTLEFDQEGRLSGSTGCNRFAGTYTQDGSKLRIQLGPVTKAACTSKDLQSQEERILAALPKVRTVEQSGRNITLADGDDQDLLSYSAVSNELAGTSWKVTGVNRNGGVETSALTEKLTADFGKDGTVSGDGGCNRFTGKYTQDGTTIAITDVGSTMMGCEQDVMALETDYLAALQKATSAKVSGTTLELRDDSGAVQVTLRAAG